MKSFFNKIAQLPEWVGSFIKNYQIKQNDEDTRIKLATEFFASGADPSEISDANTILHEKLNRLTFLVRAEHGAARTAFAKNICCLDNEGNDRVAKTWREFCEILENGIENAKQEISQEDSEQQQSLGRIAYGVVTFTSWYRKQDRRVEPLLDYIGNKTNGLVLIPLAMIPEEGVTAYTLPNGINVNLNVTVKNKIEP